MSLQFSFIYNYCYSLVTSYQYDCYKKRHHVETQRFSKLLRYAQLCKDNVLSPWLQALQIATQFVTLFGIK